MICGCTETCRLGWDDQFTPATTELLVFTKSAKRYFDIDSVRTPYTAGTLRQYKANPDNPVEEQRPTAGQGPKEKVHGWQQEQRLTHVGAPPLDWWLLKPDLETLNPGGDMTATMYIGDALETMAKLPEKSVDLILTSPPFLALRSYLPGDHELKAKEGGSQATPGEYIDWLIDFAEACDRVLAPHGSLCVELGDTYSGSGGGGGDYYEGGLREGQPGFTGSEAASREALKDANAAHWRQKNPPKVRLRKPCLHNRYEEHPWDDQDGIRRRCPGGEFLADNPGAVRLKRPCEHGWYDEHPDDSGGLLADCPGGDFVTANPRVQSWPLAKSLSLIPELFRFSLVYGFNPLTGRQTERWRLRNVVRWVRPNPPVGALGDKFRPATSELMVFCKSAKRYFDLDAVREVNHPERMDRRDSGGRPNMPAGLGNMSAGTVGSNLNPAGAPPLDWWNIPPGGYEGSHYAVFPPELCVKPIKAMCPEKVCRVCGEPTRRIVETNPEFAGVLVYQRTDALSGKSLKGKSHPEHMPRSKIPSGFSDCGHDDWRPGLVLDPFGGSGTTALVATGHGRDCILIDLDSRNYDLALERVGPFILELGEIEDLKQEAGPL